MKARTEETICAYCHWNLSGGVTVETPCPACGQPIDYCQGHGEIGDPINAAALAAHDYDDHTYCHPAADCRSGDADRFFQGVSIIHMDDEPHFGNWCAVHGFGLGGDVYTITTEG